MTKMSSFKPSTPKLRVVGLEFAGVESSSQRHEDSSANDSTQKISLYAKCQTLFSLTIEKQEWHLCSEDLRNFIDGTFIFDDCREPVRVGKAAQAKISQRANGFLQFTKDAVVLRNVYDRHFRDNEGSYGRLSTHDLGRKFIFADCPFVFLGSIKRARKFKLAALSLIDGRVHKFIIGAVETRLCGDNEHESV